MTKTFRKKRLSTEGRSRRRAGVLLSGTGICLNLMLFGLKYTAGLLSGSIAITADGFNNLADAGSCLLALLGFYLGDMKPKRSFPFGYGRLEYLSGLLISLAILGIGGRMMISSVGKILHPEDVDGSAAVIVILLISVAVKGVMYFYNNRVGRMIRSAGMRAAALDSLADCVATLAILAAVVIESLTGFNADGYTGVLVALCILYAGFTSVKESVAPLLGRGIDDDALNRLEKIIAADQRIEAYGETAVHDYGPEKRLLTLYIRTKDAKSVIPALRERIRAELNMEAVICPCEDFTPQMHKQPVIRRKYSKTIKIQERERFEY